MAMTYDEQETLHDISFMMGYEWHALAPNVRSYLIDAVDGSRGLGALSVAWADDFAGAYRYDQHNDESTLNGKPVDDYLEAIDAFFNAKWNDFIARHVARRLAH